MSRQKSIEKLIRAGRGGEVATLMQEHSRDANARYEGLRAETSRTPEWRRWMIAKEAKSARERLDSELERRAATATVDDRGDVERVLGVGGIPGDVATLIIARRDATDRVSQIEDRADLRDLLARATRSGDETLARAIAERALEQRDIETLNLFVEDRPEASEATQRLWNRGRNQAGSVNQLDFLMSGMKPSEFSTFDEVTYAAGQGEPGAA